MVRGRKEAGLGTWRFLNVKLEDDRRIEKGVHHQSPRAYEITPSLSAANRPQPVFPTLHQQGSEFLLNRSRRLSVPGPPFDRLAPWVILTGDPGEDAAVAASPAANWMLAVVQNLGVFVFP